MNVDGGVVHFRVLGPLSVEQEGMALSSISALMLRRLLAGLLIRPNECVSVDDLISALWGHSAPPAARRTLLVYIRRLRSALGDEARIVHDPAGYRIVVHDGELDCVEFGQLASNARTATGTRAADLLSEALKLWHGNAYEDVREHSPIADEARRLDEERVQAEIRHAEVKLELGQHAELIPRLTRLIEMHRFHEDLRRHLMLALYRSGRQTDALETYRQTRKLLAEELGVEPDPHLQRLHEAILRNDGSLDLVDAPKTIVPRELPADISGFVGRAEQIQTLNERLADSSPVVISAIGGSAGVGKTALAVHWAHAVADQFPDGQLYINLRGFDPSGPPLTPVDAIRRFLDSLGVAPQRIPASAAAKVTLYRSLLAGKRTLVLLDNARDAEQVRPLLPGSPTCLVVVTTRNQMASLVATSNACPLLLDVLTRAEARSLLAIRLGAERIKASPEPVEEIITRCAQLPLALAIAAAHAAVRPELSLSDLASELGHTHAFNSDDPMTDLWAVFSWSYKQLSPATAWLFRLLGVHPGPEISAHAAASLAGLPLHQVRPLLDELTRANLVTESTPGRYAFHDLLRAYSTKQGHSYDSGEDQQAALHRLLDHYLHTAHAADGMLNPQREQIQIDPPQPGSSAATLHDDAQALAWFAVERPILLALCHRAAETGFDAHAWQLPWAMTTFLDRQGHWRDWVESQYIAVDAAQRLGESSAQAVAHHLLGCAHNQLLHDDEAQAHFEQALALHRKLGNSFGQAHAHNNLGLLFARQSRYSEAINHAEQVAELHMITGNLVYRARAINAVGWYHGLNGDHQQALIYCQQALMDQQELGDVAGQAETWDSIGRARQHLSDHNQAIVCYQRSLELHQDVGDRYYVADTLVHLGDAYDAAGDPDSARDSWQSAIMILTDLDHPDAAEVRTKLTQ